MLKIKVGTTTLHRVREIARTRGLARDAYVTPGGQGAKSQRWTITGYIISTPAGIVLDQDTLEDALAAEGEATIAIVNHAGTTITSFPGRVSDISWRTYGTGPIAFYTITVETNAKSNPFSGTVMIGTATLDNPIPAVIEQYRVVNEDDPMDTTHSRTFRVQGRYMSDPAGVQAFMEALEDALTTGSTNGYFTFTTQMGTFEARARQFEISRPEQVQTQAAITYSIDLETRPDYSLDSFSLPHEPVSVGGITWDVLNSFSHSIDRVQKATSAIYRISSESLSWSLKKFFTSLGAAESFRATVEALVNSRHTMASPTGMLLECKSVSYNVTSLDGHDPNDSSKRYSVTVSLSYSKPSSQRDNEGGTAFGVIFDEITSDSRGVTIDDNGGIKNRNRNVSGKVNGKPAASILGSAVAEADGVFYITGLNVGRIDEDGKYEISISGRTLESAEQTKNYIDEVFEGIHFNDVRSKSRSVSLSRILQTSDLEVTSLTEGISGDVWGLDAENLLMLISTLGGHFGLPKLTSMNVGDKQEFTHPTTHEPTFKQSVSLTRSTQYLPTEEPAEEPTPESEDPPQFDPHQPDVKEDTATSFDLQRDKFATIVIPGGDIVKKKVGVEPRRARSRLTNTARNFRIFESMSEPHTPAAPAGISDPTETANRTGTQGLSKWREIEWEDGQID